MTAAPQDPRFSGPRVLDPRVLGIWGAGLGMDTYLGTWGCNEIGIHSYSKPMAWNELDKKLET